MMTARAQPTLALRPFLAADAPLLAQIFRASIEELTSDDYSEAQQQAWAADGGRRSRFAERLANAVTLLGTIDGSPVGFASLDGPERLDMLYVHPAAAGHGVGSMLLDAVERLAGIPRRRPAHRRRERQRAGVLPPARFRAAATQHRSARRRMAGQHDDGKEACRQGAHAMKHKREMPAPRFQKHHIILAVVAVVVAVALALNYYLW